MYEHIGRRWAWAVPFALAFTACEKVTHTTLLDLACGPLKLRFEEKMSSNISVTQWHVSLLRESAGKWVPVGPLSGIGWGFGPETFSRLIAPDLAYHAIPFDHARAVVDYPRPDWTVFVDPETVTRGDYEAISACLASNAADIDRALVAARPDGGTPAGGYASALRYPELTGTIYARPDSGFGSCGGQTLGSRWDCADGRAYIKTVMGGQIGQLRLCQIERPPAPGESPFPLMSARYMTVATISADQASIHLHEPTSEERQKGLYGQEARTYYATCRDAAGKTIFDTFKVAQAQPSKSGAAPR